MASREQVMQALFALLQSTGSFVTVSRRNRNPEGLSPAQCPALFLLEDAEEPERKSLNLPPVRKLTVKVIFYNDVGQDENAVPSSLINVALDALDVALQPDNLQTGFCTLGGLVFAIYISGSVVKAPGDITGKSIAIVPLRIILP